MSTDGLRQPLSGGASIGGIDDSVEIYCFINQYVGVQMWWLHDPPFPQSPDVLAIFGGGYAIDLLPALPWIANQPLHYWGDLDTHGFAILSRLRQ